MHILLVLLAILGTALYLTYRLGFSHGNGRNFADDTHAPLRKRDWQDQHLQKPIDTLADPRKAAIVLMLETAKADGEMTQTQRSKVLHLSAHYFEINRNNASDMIASASFITRSLTDIHNVIGRVVRPLQENLSPKERRDCIKMMYEVANADGNPSPNQIQLIGRVKDLLLR